ALFDDRVEVIVGKEGETLTADDLICTFSPPLLRSLDTPHPGLVTRFREMGDLKLTSVRRVWLQSVNDACPGPASATTDLPGAWFRDADEGHGLVEAWLAGPAARRFDSWDE